MRNREREKEKRGRANNGQAGLRDVQDGERTYDGKVHRPGCGLVTPSGLVL